MRFAPSDSPSRPAPSARLPAVDPAVLEGLDQVVPGGLRSRPSDRLGSAHDASHYLLTPQAIVTPTDARQVAEVMRTSAARGMSLTFRSGGTSLSGQSSTAGVLADTRRHFRDIEVLDEGARVRVQPGATIRAVNARLTRYGRKLGPDPASESAATVGGVVANNSSGMACGIVANTYRTLESAVLVLPSGTVLDTAAPDADERLRALEPSLHEGLLRLRDRVRADPRSVATIERLYAMKNTMGYGLNSFLDHDSATQILLHLVIGSEGTLAFVASATFRTVPLLSHAATGFLVFDDLDRATAVLPELVAAGFATIELLDATSLRVAQSDPRATADIRTLRLDRHAALLVEHQSDSADLLAEKTHAARRLIARLPVSAPAEIDSDPAARAARWHIRKGLYAAVAGQRPSGTTALLEDVAVPVPALLHTCVRLVELFERHGYDDSVIFGHAKDGNIHFLLNERFDDRASLARYIAFTDEMVDLVLGQGGTLKAEHGTGRVMAPYVRRQYGDELYEVMLEVKRLVDPGRLLNPGVLLDESPDGHVSNLKVTPSVEAEVDRCVECGYCEPVCPSKDLTLTPRVRIALRREMADAAAAGDSELLASLEADYRYDAVETCAVDGMCATACPVLIDTGDLVRRLRGEQQGPLARAGGVSTARHWAGATRLGGTALTAAARLPAPLVAGTAAAARRVFGEDLVPQWSPDLPAGGSPRRSRPDDDPEIVFLPACIGTMFGPAGDGPGVTSAFLELCARADVRVRIPEGVGAMCCGTPWKSKGLVDGYAAMRETMRAALWTATDRGRIPVVCDAASCTEGLVTLLGPDGDDSPGIPVIDAVAFAEQRLLPRLEVTAPVRSLALHPTCSSTQLGTGGALARIAAAIAGEVVVPDDWGCCAFAGDRGMLHPELTASATAREAAELADSAVEVYASTNRTCEIGLSRATGHQYEHLLETLERATRPGAATTRRPA